MSLVLVIFLAAWVFVSFDLFQFVLQVEKLVQFFTAECVVLVSNPSGFRTFFRIRFIHQSDLSRIRDSERFCAIIKQNCVNMIYCQQVIILNHVGHWNWTLIEFHTIKPN